MQVAINIKVSVDMTNKTQVRIEGFGNLSSVTREFLSKNKYTYQDSPKHCDHCDQTSSCQCYCIYSFIPKEDLDKFDFLAYNDDSIIDWYSSDDLI
jgi:hypothetical protein